MEGVTWIISQGATNSFTLTWNIGTPAAPVLYDFTGHTARCQARKGPGTTPWFTLTSEGSDAGMIDLDGTSMKVTLFGETSTAWGTQYQSGRWDLELIDAEGSVTRLMMGKIEVSLEITED